MCERLFSYYTVNLNPYVQVTGKAVGGNRMRTDKVMYEHEGSGAKEITHTSRIP